MRKLPSVISIFILSLSLPSFVIRWLSGTCVSKVLFTWLVKPFTICQDYKSFQAKFPVHRLTTVELIRHNVGSSSVARIQVAAVSLEEVFTESAFHHLQFPFILSTLKSNGWFFISFVFLPSVLVDSLEWTTGDFPTWFDYYISSFQLPISLIVHFHSFLVSSPPRPSLLLSNNFFLWFFTLGSWKFNFFFVTSHLLPPSGWIHAQTISFEMAIKFLVFFFLVAEPKRSKLSSLEWRSFNFFEIPILLVSAPE